MRVVRDAGKLAAASSAERTVIHRGAAPRAADMATVRYRAARLAGAAAGQRAAAPQ